jgi:hypothetical protein
MLYGLIRMGSASPLNSPDTGRRRAAGSTASQLLLFEGEGIVSHQ